MTSLSPRRVVLGLSGGVDSAVAARLLQREGYEVFGLYLDIATESAREDAVATAEFLSVPLTVLDISEALETHVCAPFVRAYLSGQTPNPCILCNPAVKFKSLIDHADAVGAQYIATGHYARTADGMLFKGHPSNDQSYMLCRLTRPQVSRLLLPLGEFEKTQVRALAQEMNIPVANKPDSMEICFIPDKDYIGWLSRRAQVPGPGPITFNGETISTHEGIHRWTVGQRLPGLWNERKLYVSAIRAETNEIVAALWDDLFKTELTITDVNWLIDPPSGPIRGSVRVRHTKWENPDCTIIPTPTGAVIRCDSPVRAPAPGQSAVLYQSSRLIASGGLCPQPTAAAQF